MKCSFNFEWQSVSEICDKSLIFIYLLSYILTFMTDIYRSFLVSNIILRIVIDNEESHEGDLQIFYIKEISCLVF